MKLYFSIICAVFIILSGAHSHAVQFDELAPETDIRSKRFQKGFAKKGEDIELIRENARRVCTYVFFRDMRAHTVDKKRVERMMELFLEMGPYSLETIKQKVDLVGAYSMYAGKEKDKKDGDDYGTKEKDELWEVFNFLVLLGFDMKVMEAIFPKTAVILGFKDAYAGQIAGGVKKHFRGGYYHVRPEKPSDLARDDYFKSDAYLAFLNLKPGDTYLDMMGGKGDEAIGIAKKFSKVNVLMMDANARNIYEALRDAEKKKLRNIRFIIGDVRTVKEDELLAKGPVKAVTFTGWAFAGFRNAEMKEAFTRALHVLKPGGRIFFDTRDRRELFPFYSAVINSELYARHNLELEKARDRDRYPLIWFGAEKVLPSEITPEDIMRFFFKMQTLDWYAEGLKGMHAGLEFCRVSIVEEDIADDFHRIIHLPGRKLAWMVRKLKSIYPGIILIGSSRGEPSPLPHEKYSDDIVNDYRFDRKELPSYFLKLARYYIKSIEQLDRDNKIMEIYKGLLSKKEIPLKKEDRRELFVEILDHEVRKAQLLWSARVLSSPEEVWEEMLVQRLVPPQKKYLPAAKISSLPEIVKDLPATRPLETPQTGKFDESVLAPKSRDFSEESEIYNYAGEKEVMRKLARLLAKAGIYNKSAPEAFMPYFELEASRKNMNLEEYIDFLLQNEKEFIDCFARIKNIMYKGVTKGSRTWLFRDYDRWGISLAEFLRALIKSKAENKDFTICVKSIGSSAGKEAYSIGSMIYRQLVEYAESEIYSEKYAAPERKALSERWAGSWDVRLEAYDINVDALDTALEGVYEYDRIDDKAVHGQPGANDGLISRSNRGFEVSGKIKKWLVPIFADMTDPVLMPVAEKNKGEIIFCRYLFMWLGADQKKRLAAELMEGGLENSRYPSFYCMDKDIDLPMIDREVRFVIPEVLLDDLCGRYPGNYVRISEELGVGIVDVLTLRIKHIAARMRKLGSNTVVLAELGQIKEILIKIEEEMKSLISAKDFQKAIAHRAMFKDVQKDLEILKEILINPEDWDVSQKYKLALEFYSRAHIIRNKLLAGERPETAMFEDKKYAQSSLQFEERQFYQAGDLPVIYTPVSIELSPGKTQRFFAVIVLPGYDPGQLETLLKIIPNPQVITDGVFLAGKEGIDAIMAEGGERPVGKRELPPADKINRQIEAFDRSQRKKVVEEIRKKFNNYLERCKPEGSRGRKAASKEFFSHQYLKAGLESNEASDAGIYKILLYGGVSSAKGGTLQTYYSAYNDYLDIQSIADLLLRDGDDFAEFLGDNRLEFPMFALNRTGVEGACFQFDIKADVETFAETLYGAYSDWINVWGGKMPERFFWGVLLAQNDDKLKKKLENAFAVIPIGRKWNELSAAEKKKIIGSIAGEFSIINRNVTIPPVGLEDESVNLIYMRNSVNYFSRGSLKELLDEAYRVLKPGGFLVVDERMGKEQVRLLEEIGQNFSDKFFVARMAMLRNPMKVLALRKKSPQADNFDEIYRIAEVLGTEADEMDMSAFCKAFFEMFVMPRIYPGLDIFDVIFVPPVPKEVEDTPSAVKNAV